MQNRIAEAARAAGRAPEEVTLLAVSKRHPASAIASLADAGQRAFGENYVSEAVDKIERLGERHLEWHFIGPIQSNKTRLIAQHFSWVHSVDRAKILRRLAEARSSDHPPLNCCLQVNLEAESSKSGASVDDVGALIELATTLPQLALQGLMCIPRPSSDADEQRAVFRRLRELRDSLRGPGVELPVLSMGMSGDLEAAIAEGATMVRIGTALFGPRT